MKNKKMGMLVGSLVLIAAVAAGIALTRNGNRETVGVYPFTMVGMDGYWGDSQESYGPVSTDKIQTVFLSDTQTVTEVLVAQGDKVKKGDVLMTFDTTLSDLQLERKRLEVEKLKLELDAANAELQRIRSLKPMEEVPEETPQLPQASTYQGATLTAPYKTYLVAGHDGKSMDTAFVCWIKEDTYVEDTLLEALRQLVWKDQGLCIHGNSLATCSICNCTHGGKDGEVCEFCNECVHGVIEAACNICNPVICEHENVKDLCPKCKCEHGNIRGTCDICSPFICEHDGVYYITSLCPIHNPKCEHGNIKTTCNLCYCPHGVAAGDCPICYCPHKVLRSQACSQCQQAEAQGIGYEGTGYRVQLLAEATAGTAPNSYFVIFKATSGNTELGPQTVWQGAHVQGLGKGFTLRYFTPFTGDYTVPVIETPEVQLPETDTGSGLTAAQIAEMRSAQELKIKDLTLKHKMANADYQILCKEMGDGHIYAEFDGEVVSLLSEEEAKAQKQPVVKVSGGGGFFIQGSVSELEKDNLKIGQEVTVNDWNNGGVYTGTVREIGDFPSLDGYWNGAGNPNTTYYPFTVFVGEEASLQSGNYASIQYSTSESSGGIYLEKAFIRTEDGRSYVFVRDGNNRLEKRFLTTGKTLWGSYIEVLSGITAEDYIAFPYGKNVKSGAPAEEKDLSELYGY